MSSNKPPLLADATRDLARFGAALRYEDIPAEAVARIKLSLLDSLGCCLFGATLPWTRKVAELAHVPSCPVVCPMLDETEGACPVYAQRPVACRTYGFYVQRELGLYCADIEARVADGELGDVVWGNHDAVDHALGALGELRALTEWFEGDSAED